jgi:hypothetical protein
MEDGEAVFSALVDDCGNKLVDDESFFISKALIYIYIYIYIILWRHDCAHMLG